MALHSHRTAFAHGQAVAFTHQATGYPTPTNSLTQCTDSDPQGKMLSTPSDLFTHSHTCLDNGRQAGLYAEVFPRSTEIPSFRVQHVQALLSLCSKSCFTFPSWYLFTVGPGSMFAFRWTLPPTSHTNPRGCNSWTKHHIWQGTTHDKQDSHPSQYSCSKGLYMHLHWLHVLELQLRARCPNFHFEPIPVHSPLLRTPFLVNHQLPTYMLKFSCLISLSSSLSNQTENVQPAWTCLLTALAAVRPTYTWYIACQHEAFHLPCQSRHAHFGSNSHIALGNRCHTAGTYGQV